jgi:hypothetical protein
MPRQSAAAYIGPNITGSPERLKPPGHLTSIERAIFVDIVAGCKADHFRPSDLPLLAAYCAAIALEREAITRLRKDGRVIDGRGQPLGNLWDARLMLRLDRGLGPVIGCRCFNALQIWGQGRALHVCFLRAFGVDRRRVRWIFNAPRRSLK